MARLTRLAAAALVAAAPDAMGAQQDNGTERLKVPFGVGERLTYEVKFGKLKVGNGSMEVMGLDTVRGRETWHTQFRVKGGTFFYKVNDLFESWIDTRTLSSLRYHSDQEEGGRDREKKYEIFPEQQQFAEQGKPMEASVRQPLDDGSFLYFVRTVPLEVGQTYEFYRYFRPDRNPVKIQVLRKERVKVPAGEFDAIVIQPVIKAKGIFSESGRAEIWLADDSTRVMLQMKSKLSIGTLSLYLKGHRPQGEKAEGATGASPK